MVTIMLYPTITFLYKEQVHIRPWLLVLSLHTLHAKLLESCNLYNAHGCSIDRIIEYERCIRGVPLLYYPYETHVYHNTYIERVNACHSRTLMRQQPRNPPPPC